MSTDGQKCGQTPNVEQRACHVMFGGVLISFVHPSTKNLGRWRFVGKVVQALDILSGQISSRPHTTNFPEKVAFWNGNPRISGKSRLVKHYNLARSFPFVCLQGIYQHGLWHAWSQRPGSFSACHPASRDAWELELGSGCEEPTLELPT